MCNISGAFHYMYTLYIIAVSLFFWGKTTGADFFFPIVPCSHLLSFFGPDELWAKCFRFRNDSIRTNVKKTYTQTKRMQISDKMQTKAERSVLSRQLQPTPIFAWSPLENYEFSINKHTKCSFKALALFCECARTYFPIVCFMAMFAGMFFFAYQKWFNILLLLMLLLFLLVVVDVDGTEWHCTNIQQRDLPNDDEMMIKDTPWMTVKMLIKMMRKCQCEMKMNTTCNFILWLCLQSDWKFSCTKCCWCIFLFLLCDDDDVVAMVFVLIYNKIDLFPDSTPNPI